MLGIATAMPQLNRPIGSTETGTAGTSRPDTAAFTTTAANISDEAGAHRALRRPAPGHALGEHGADHHPAYGRAEQPHEAAAAEAQMLEDEDWRRQHVEEESVEVQRHPERQQHEGRVAEDRSGRRAAAAADAVAGGPPRRASRAGSARSPRRARGRTGSRKKKIARQPAEREQARSHQRRQRRREPEDQHHPRHQALRLRPLVQVAHHRAPDHDPRTAAQALQRAARTTATRCSAPARTPARRARTPR